MIYLYYVNDKFKVFFLDSWTNEKNPSREASRLVTINKTSIINNNNINNSYNNSRMISVTIIGNSN